MTQDTITIRDATRADLIPLHRLVESAYRGDSARMGWTHEADWLDDPRTDADSLIALIDDADQLVLTAWAGDEVIGCANVARLSADKAYFGLFAVDPHRQNGGLGKTILAAAEEAARARMGATIMEMTVISRRAELIAYYERRGYHQTGEVRPFPVVVTPPLYLVVLEKLLPA